ncbi:MAG TPA: LacI family DNA-binding transcriptional regulator [Flavitalea sp.]|nr:LacI family DNA-binding transcriptional regulator [Flavitalea sp.]
MNQKRTTLKDIAERLNVSITTVNRALKDHPDISKNLKEKVLFLAEQLHYRPNYFASSLRTNHSGLIGVIMPKIIHYFSSTVLSGIVKTSNRNNYQVIIGETDNNVETEKASLLNMMNSGVDGILIAVSNNTTNEDHFAAMQNENVPLVFFDKVPDHIDGPKVLTNDKKGAMLATEHLIKQGYRAIAHLKGQAASRNAVPRFMGYKSALEKHKISYNEKLIRQCLVASEEEGYELTMELMKMRRKPDAIFAINDETAIGALAALRSLKINVPQQVGVVGFSNIKAGMYLQPTLSSVEQFGSDIGKVATEILIDMINAGTVVTELMHRKTFVEPKLYVRESSLRNSISGKG